MAEQSTYQALVATVKDVTEKIIESENNPPFNYNDVYTKKPKKEGDVGFYTNPFPGKYESDFGRLISKYGPAKILNEIEEKELANRHRVSEFCH